MHFRKKVFCTNVQCFHIGRRWIQEREPFIEVGDIGNDLEIFSRPSFIRTYGVAVQDCPELDESCLPSGTGITVACLLPRDICP